MNTIKIFDTSTLICIFQEAKFPKLIDNCKSKGYRIVISTHVFEELKANKNTYSDFKKYEKYIEIKQCSENDFDNLMRRYPRLHKGEVSVICLGLEFKSNKNKFLCFLDDSYARNISKKLLLNTAGVIALALWEKNNGYICAQECKIIHDNISKSFFRIKKEILDELIK